MEHLRLEVFDREGTGSKYAVLEPNTTITITDTSEIFAKGDLWSYSFTLNVYDNAHLFGSAGDIHGSRLHEQIDKRKARLWFDGLPLHLGYLKLGDETEVDADGNVNVSFESGQKTFEYMIEGAKANQVPMMNDVRFGLALWTRRWSILRLGLTATVKLKGGMVSDGGRLKHTPRPGAIPGDNNEDLTVFEVDGENDFNVAQQYPRMVFPKGRFMNLRTDAEETINELNTDSPYTEDENGTPTHPYCNVALCYQKYDYKKTDKDGNVTTIYAEEPEAQREYEYMPANRVNSAPNFYVIYWLRCLMKHLGIYVEENQMMDVEDLRRLFFVNTNCAYKEPKYIRNTAYDWKYGKYQPVDTKLIPEYFGVHDEQNNKYDGLENLVKTDSCGFRCSGYTAGKWIAEMPADQTHPEPYKREVELPDIESVSINVAEVAGMSDTIRQYYDGPKARNRYLFDAIATSDCFPNVDISEVISAIESGFGIRFLFSDEYRRVRIVLLRNIFSSDDVQDIACDIIDEDVKVENNKRGFRMTYGNTEDTHFYYKGFADLLPHIKTLWPDTSDKHDYSFWNLNAEYQDLIHRISAFDKTCSVTPNTGNAYGIKIDKDAKRYDELHPALFEFAGFMDAEDGDCTGEEETIETINVGFVPAIMNDLNMEQERRGDTSQQFALFVDEAMRVRRPDLKDLPNEETQPGVNSYNDADAVYDVDSMYAKYGPGSNNPKIHDDSIVAPGEFAITSDLSASQSGLKAAVRVLLYIGGGGGSTDMTRVYATCNLSDISITGNANEGFRLYLQDNYEPNDDGISPIETHDWGLTLGIMRGSGTDAYINELDDPDDDENNTWEIVPGSSVTAHPDTCDSYGNEWDYDGGTFVWYGGTAIEQMQKAWPDSNISLVYSSGTVLRNKDTYINSATVQSVIDYKGDVISLLFATTLGGNGQTVLYNGKIKDYARKFKGMRPAQMRAFDAGSQGFGILIEVGSSMERMRTLLELQKRAFVYDDTDADPIRIDPDGVGSRYGRFSLKLRAEKPNPDFDADQEESEDNRRYLKIDNENLRGRGICDQFYSGYSYWVRNARIVKRKVDMTLAQLITIDKTKRVHVGDVTGFIRKMQYSLSNQTGLGSVEMEIMYI